MSWMPCPDAVSQESSSASDIAAMIVPRAVNVGEMEVRRALPSERREMIGPFVFFDQMGPTAFDAESGLAVRPHPHINLATLTYLFEGEIVHRDSLGNALTIRPGAVNWMRAGSGIVHSERSSKPLTHAAQRLWGLQTWVALPEDQEESNPEFVHLDREELPSIDWKGLRARVIAGQAFGEQSPLETASPTLYVDIALESNRDTMIEARWAQRGLYVVSGKVNVGGRGIVAGQMALLTSGRTVKATAETNARFVLFGGEPMDGPRHIWWNFVSSRRDRIEQAKEDWAQGRFETVPGDVVEFIPLPEGRGSPRRLSPGR